MTKLKEKSTTTPVAEISRARKNKVPKRLHTSTDFS